MISSLLSYLLFPVTVLDGGSQVKWFRPYSATYYFMWQSFLYYRTPVVLIVVVMLNDFVSMLILVLQMGSNMSDN